MYKRQPGKRDKIQTAHAGPADTTGALVTGALTDALVLLAVLTRLTFVCAIVCVPRILSYVLIILSLTKNDTTAPLQSQVHL